MTDNRYRPPAAKRDAGPSTERLSAEVKRPHLTLVASRNEPYPEPHAELAPIGPSSEF